MQIVADRIPVLLKTISLRFKEQLLKSTVELPDCLLFIDALIALQPLDDGIPRRRDRLGQSGLATARRTFHNHRLLHPRREVDDLKGDRVDYIFRRFESLAEIFDRREHDFPLARFYWETRFGRYFSWLRYRHRDALLISSAAAFCRPEKCSWTYPSRTALQFAFRQPEKCS